MNRTARKNLKLLAALLAALLAVTGCGQGGGSSADNSLKEITEKGKLTLGCDDSFPPMGFRDESGEIVGFDIDLARGVAEKLGVELEVKPVVWENKELELINGNIDVIWNGYTIMASRDEQVEFTKPYLNNQQVVAVKKDAPINTLADLEGKTLGCQAASAAEDVVNGDEALRSSLADLKSYNDYQTALMDLRISDRVDAIAGDKVLIEYEMTKMPDTFRILDESLSEEYYGIGCRKGAKALAAAIDKALDDMQSDGSIDAICANWFENNIVIRDKDKLTQKELKELEE
ncbi:MAG: amino acid ABC transporter substrate-binding protein [Clostridiales Family XIII bacterium]|jgi:polar amino acid transport system substrate-binding protein|nr:amino acid ABC transporter substrate-binding protein [Clostridiales Family XIII bacterium]